MIEIVECPYLGEKAAKKEERLIRCLLQNKPVPDCYVLTISAAPGNLLELTPSWVFRQSYFKKHSCKIYGIACGKQEGLSVMVRVIMDCYQETGQFDVRSYLEGRGD